MRYFTYIFWAIIVLIVVSFASLNSHKVSVNFYIHQSNIYFPLLLLLVLIVGCVLGILSMMPGWLKAKNNARKLRKRMRQIEQEVKNLRSIPMKDEH